MCSSKSVHWHGSCGGITQHKHKTLVLTISSTIFESVSMCRSWRHRLTSAIRARALQQQRGLLSEVTLWPRWPRTRFLRASERLTLMNSTRINSWTTTTRQPISRDPMRRRWTTLSGNILYCECVNVVGTWAWTCDMSAPRSLQWVCLHDFGVFRAAVTLHFT